jgi:hypothetical protein
MRTCWTGSSSAKLKNNNNKKNDNDKSNNNDKQNERKNDGTREARKRGFRGEVSTTGSSAC